MPRSDRCGRRGQPVGGEIGLVKKGDDADGEFELDMSTVTSGHLDVSPHADVSARVRVRTHVCARAYTRRPASTQAPCAQVLRRDVSLAQLSRRMSLLDEAAVPVLVKLKPSAVQDDTSGTAAEQLAASIVAVRHPLL